MKDHYKTLGLTETVKQADIKKKYRQLASKYHPDRNKSPNAGEILKEINEAYTVLGNAKRKADYDFQRRQRQSNSTSDSEFNNMFNDLRRKAAQAKAEQRVKQRPKTFIAKVTLEQAYTGVTMPSQFGEVIVPAGVRSGTRLFLQKDKIFVEIEVIQHHKFKRANDDLLAELTVDSFEAILGTEATITHLDGKKYKFRLPPGIQQGHIAKLGSKGMPNPELNTVGDLLVRVTISTPTNLTQTEKDVIISINKGRNIDI